MSYYKLATRLRCEVCGAEALVVRAGDGPLKCCGVEMSQVSKENQSTPLEGEDHGD